jgi:putative transcriptional regulator
VLAALTLPALGQTAAPPRSLLLIAAPSLQDPNFHRTVVLVVQTAGGPFGVVLNRPGAATVGDVLPQAPPAVATLSVHFGGPVSPRGLGMLFSADEAPPGAVPMLNNLYFSGSRAVLETLARQEPPPRRLRVFAGYSGWAPGQLEAELERGDWWVWPADEQTIFDTPTEELWPKLLARATARRAQRPAETPVRGELTGGGGGVLRALAPADDAEEHLVLADHAQLGAGPLLDGLGTLLEVTDLGVQRRVARAQVGVVQPLLLDPPVQLPHRLPAALAQPKRVLQRGEQRQQHGGEQLHWRSW